jgi:MFS family permease
MCAFGMVKAALTLIDAHTSVGAVASYRSDRSLSGHTCAGAAPIIYGLLSDLFAPSQRAFVTTCVVLSQGAGIALGQAVAGGIPGLDWRMPFVFVSVPAVTVAVVMACTTTDPQRGAAEPALKAAVQLEGFQYDEHLSWRKLWALFTTKTNLLVILQVSCPLLGPWHCCAIWT